MVRASRRKFHVLYKTTNIVTGNYYIGIHSTDDLEDDYLGSGLRLRRSVKKYGKASHQREIVELLESRSALIAREAEIVTFDLIIADIKCMNLIPGGGGNDREYGASELARAKMSAASKAAIRTPEWYAKAVSTRRENDSYQHSVETKAKISEAHTGKVLTDEHKQKIGRSLVGRIVTEETRQKLAERHSLNVANGVKYGQFGLKSDETRQKLREAQTGKVYSEEAKAKMSEKAKARVTNPNYKNPSSRSCTKDGIEIFETVKAMREKYGKGLNGLRHPNFRFV